MRDQTPKFDTTDGPTGEYTAAEFNDLHDDNQNAITGTGQTLTPTAGDNNEQIMNAMAIGGRRKSRASGQTADVADIVLADNSSGSVTIDLPLIADVFVNATVDFEPVDDQLYSVNALIIGRNGQLIMGLAEDMTINSVSFDNLKIRMTWIGGSVGWLVSRGTTIGTTL